MPRTVDQDKVKQVKSILRKLQENGYASNYSKVYVDDIMWIKTIHNDDKVQKTLFLAIPVLLAGDLIIGKYSLLLFGREFPAFYSRNWLFVGVPYFSLGMLIRKHLPSIKERIYYFGRGKCFVLL